MNRAEFAASEFGINEEHFANGFSSFTLEDNYRFKKEFLEGQLIHPYFRLYNVNEKLFHLIGALFDDDNNICAMYETVEGHVDMSIRKNSSYATSNDYKHAQSQRRA